MAVITQLLQLNDIDNLEFTVTFIDSLEAIFKWAQTDILSTINARNNDVLLALRNELCSKIKETFPDFYSKTPINRRAKHLVAKDICIIGDCLVKGVTNNDLEKIVFCQNPAGSELGPMQ